MNIKIILTIMITKSIARNINLSRRHLSVCWFAKEAPKKNGKKEEAAPVVQEEESVDSIVKRWLEPNHPSLSPS